MPRDYIEDLIERWSRDEFKENRINRLLEAIHILEQHLEKYGKVTKTDAFNFITSQIEHYKFLIKFFEGKEESSPV